MSELASVFRSTIEKAGLHLRVSPTLPEPDMRDYVRRLGSECYQVEAVADGNSTLDAASQNISNLILADVMMPGLDDFHLLQEVRADPVTKETPYNTTISSWRRRIPCGRSGNWGRRLSHQTLFLSRTAGAG